MKSSKEVLVAIVEPHSGNMPLVAACKMCGNTDLTKIATADGSDIFKCGNDGLVFRNIAMQPEELQTQHARLTPSDLDWLPGRRKLLAKYADIIKRYKRGGSLLDLGCAIGLFFENFDRSDWRLHGQDVSPERVNIAQEKGLAKVACGALRDIRYADRAFDAITVLDCVQYIPDLNGEFKELHRILKDDGILALEIPGYWAAWTLRARGLWGPNRLYFLSPRTVRYLLESTGFRIIQYIPLWNRGHGLKGLIHKLYFLLAWLMAKVTANRVSIAFREMYIAIKA
jgi:SAM-dependent methyltransferase